MAEAHPELRTCCVAKSKWWQGIGGVCVLRCNLCRNCRVWDKMHPLSVISPSRRQPVSYKTLCDSSSQTLLEFPCLPPSVSASFTPLSLPPPSKIMKPLFALILICLTASGLSTAATTEPVFQVEIAATIDGFDVNQLLFPGKEAASDTSRSSGPPRVITKLGQKAVVSVAREYRYATAFSAPRVPSEFRTSNIGATLSITPLQESNGTIYYFGSLTVTSAPKMEKSMHSKSGDVATMIEVTKWFSGDAKSGKPVKLDFLTPDGKPTTFSLLLTSMDAHGEPIKQR